MMVWEVCEVWEVWGGVWGGIRTACRLWDGCDGAEEGGDSAVAASCWLVVVAAVVTTAEPAIGPVSCPLGGEADEEAVLTLPSGPKVSSVPRCSACCSCCSGYCG